MQTVVAVAAAAERQAVHEVLDYNLLRHRAGLGIMVELLVAQPGLQGEVVVQEQSAIPFLVREVATAVLDCNTV
jgi:hypothetical protein